MRKYPLFIILILSLLIVSIPGAVISIRDRSFTYPAAAVMIQTIKNGQLMRIIGASDPGATDPGAVAAAAIREARGSQSTAASDAPEATEAKAKSAGNTVSEGNQEKSEQIASFCGYFFHQIPLSHTPLAIASQPATQFACRTQRAHFQVPRY